MIKYLLGVTHDFGKFWKQQFSNFSSNPIKNNQEIKEIFYNDDYQEYRGLYKKA